MSINPIALSLAIPLVGNAAAGGMQMLGDSFRAVFSGKGASTQLSSSGASIDQTLNSLASDLREWLSQRGITGPFSIEINSQDPSGSTLSASGPAREQILSLLNEQPDVLARLRELVQSAASSGPLGMRPATASITEQDCLLTY